MLNIFIGILIGVIVTGISCACYVTYLTKRYQSFSTSLKEITEKTNEAQLKYNILLDKSNELKQTNSDLNNQNKEIISNISFLQNEVSHTISEYCENRLAAAELILSEQLKTLADNCQEAKDEYKQEYLSMLKEYVAEFETQAREFKEQQLTLEQLKTKVDVAVAEAKRREEQKTQNNFYRLVLSEDDIKEIAHLRSIEQYLRNPDALNKVIYKVYYERPYTDLIGRVLGPNNVVGIYKITNINNDMCYIGQSTSVAERWKQHIKRGVGAETPTRNKLYPAMKAEGVENFRFELLEACRPEELNEKEKYWQTFYHAQDFGYSIR